MSGSKKRPALSSEAELAALRKQLIDQMAVVAEKEADEISAAIAAQPEAGVLDLGLTSAQGISLKGWVFHQLEAELTTFQMLKQPFSLVVEQINLAQREETGLKIPEFAAPQ